MTRIGERWERRADGIRDGREPFAAQAAAMIRSEPQAVWDFLEAPGSAVLLDPQHQRSFHVPGTPEYGVGSQTCTIRLRDSGVHQVLLSEVVEYDPPFRSLCKLLNTYAPLLERHTLAEIPGGCSLAVNIGMRIPLGSADQVGAQVRSQLQEYVAKVKALVEAGPAGLRNATDG
jgi:hypothetical protein